jgi:hypothetical protein
VVVGPGISTARVAARLGVAGEDVPGVACWERSRARCVIQQEK